MGDHAQQMFAALHPVACPDSGECPSETTTAKATTSEETVIITFPGYACTYSPSPECRRSGSGALVPTAGFAERAAGGLADAIYAFGLVLLELDDTLVTFEDADPPTLTAPPMICTLNTSARVRAFRCSVGE